MVLVRSNLGSPIGVALEVGRFATIQLDGTKDGGDIDDSCSMDAHPS